MMPRTRRFVRTLLALLLVGGCFALILAPLLAPAQAATSPTPSAPPGNLVISQVQFGTSNNQAKEFIELFNRSCSTPIPLSGLAFKWSNGSGGFQDMVFNPPIPAGAEIKPGSYYLLAYSLGVSKLGIAPDAIYTKGIPSSSGGVAVFAAGNLSTALDQAGFDIDGYFEGTQIKLSNQTGDVSYVRQTPFGGTYVDSNNNSLDFSKLSPSKPHNSSQTGVCGTPIPTSTPSATPTSSFQPQVIINEIAWYGTIADYTADWIELYNPTTSDVDLHGWTLEALDGIPSIDLDGVIKAGGFYLLVHSNTSSFATNTPTPAATPACRAFRTADNVRIDQYFTGDLSSYGEVLYLLKPNGAISDTANRTGGSWPAGSYTNHASMERHAVVPDSDTAWYTYAGTPTNFVHDCAGNRVYGTPGYANWAATVTATPSPIPTRYKTATPRPPTPFAHMVINEFLPRAGYDWNQDGTVDVFDEFVELKNLGPIPAQLSGWKIDVISPGGTSSYALSGTLQTDQRAVFYSLKTHLSLYDSGGTVRLINNRGIVVDARTYGPVQAPDQSICRIPDGFYWRFPCFPTPGLENSLTGTLPVPPPVIASQPPPCTLSDIIPDPFKQAECYGFGADVFNPAYWDDQSGFLNIPVPDEINKNSATVK